MWRPSTTIAALPRLKQAMTLPTTIAARVSKVMEFQYATSKMYSVCNSKSNVRQDFYVSNFNWEFQFAYFGVPTSYLEIQKKQIGK